MSEIKCADCGKPANPPYSNGIDEPARCGSCAVAKYKKDCPLTWNLGFKIDGIIDIDTRA